MATEELIVSSRHRHWIRQFETFSPRRETIHIRLKQRSDLYSSSLQQSQHSLLQSSAPLLEMHQ